MRRLALLAVVPVVTVLAATGGSAAAKPQIVDPKGDSVGGQAVLDIVSVQWSSTGSGAGKKYVPKKLVVTMTLAGAPATHPGVRYKISADTSTCGVLDIIYAPGNAVGSVVGDTTAHFGSCAEVLFFTPKVKGSVVTFEFSMKSIGLDAGTEFVDFLAEVDVTDPALALVGSNGGTLDKATGAGTWVI